MLCLWRQQKMEEGAVQSSKWVFFSKYPRYWWLGLGTKEGDTLLTKKHAFAPRVPAWNCPHCERVVIDYGNET